MSHRHLPLSVALLLPLLLLPSIAGATPKKTKHRKTSASVVRRFHAVIRKNHRRFDRCAQDETKHAKRKPRGLVLVRFVVNGDGKVTESGSVHNTTKSRALAECLLRNLDRLKFPATFGAPVTGSYSFKFNLKK
jgi:hypothetical protein